MGSGLARLRSFPPDSLGGFLQGTAVRLRDVTMGGAPSVFSVSRLMAPWGLYELPKLAIPMSEDGDPLPSPTLGRLKKIEAGATAGCWVRIQPLDAEG